MRSSVAATALALASCGSPSPAPQAVQSAASTTAPTVTPAATAAPEGVSTPPTITVQQVPGPAGEREVGSDILIKALGTEPFWAVNVMLGRLTYSTPESPGWTAITTQLTEDDDRLRYNGKLDGKDFILIISKGTCSDGMSDTVYPLTARLTIGTETRQGCAKAN
jgi:uncharacterized membrane protein